MQTRACFGKRCLKQCDIALPRGEAELKPGDLVLPRAVLHKKLTIIFSQSCDLGTDILQTLRKLTILYLQSFGLVTSSLQTLRKPHIDYMIIGLLNRLLIGLLSRLLIGLTITAVAATHKTFLGCGFDMVSSHCQYDENCLFITCFYCWETLPPGDPLVVIPSLEPAAQAEPVEPAAAAESATADTMQTPTSPTGEVI